jgi:glucose/arabinose dehydrogenase
MRRMIALLAALGLVLIACNGSESVGTSAPTSGPRLATQPPVSTLPAPLPATTQAPRPTTGPPVTGAPSVPPAAPPPTTTTRPPPTTIDVATLRLGLEEVASGFERPVFLTAPPGDPRLFVVDQPGRISVISGGEVGVFLDIRDDVRFGGEQGLLGLAFHPDYDRNGRFYVDYIDNDGDTVLTEYRADARDPNVADPATRRVVLRVGQPAGNHNGGMITFGPDGYLWFGLGDGGGANDRFGNGQRSDRLLGSMLRIEVGPRAPTPYGLPDTTPFVADGGLPEVWAIGLRNPWRFSFDGNDLYIADVGQRRVEEINVVVASATGLNFGWPILEGGECFQSGGCDRSGLVEPVTSYTHGNGCSVTGGYVYRGDAIAGLKGHYLFGDYCGGWVESIRVAAGRVADEREWFEPGTLPGLTSFGVDSAGEMYVLVASGTVYRIVRG